MKSNSDMDFNRDYLRRYIEIAPAAPAIERSLEYEILAAQPFNRQILRQSVRGNRMSATIRFPDRI